MTDNVIELLRAEVWKTMQEVRSARAKEAWKQREEKLKKTVLTSAAGPSSVNESCSASDRNDHGQDAGHPESNDD